MNEARILLVNFHQLLICFVLHGWLRVCSHGDQVGHTLKNEKFLIYKRPVFFFSTQTTEQDRKAKKSYCFC